MNIVHICLCGAFTEGWSYQENLLTKYHKKNGHNVTIITSEYERDNNYHLIKAEKSIYTTIDGITIYRIPNFMSTTPNSKIRIYKNLTKTLDNLEIDILFIHGVQFLNLLEIKDFLIKRKNKDIKVFIDNHADYVNSANNILSKKLLHGLIWKFGVKRIEPFTTKFYGVLPSRVKFLIEMYNLNQSKVNLLLMGADDDLVKSSNDIEKKNQVRNKIGIKDDEILIVTGGKFNATKFQVINLMKIISKNKKVKLLIFGPVTPSLREKFDAILTTSENIIHQEWAGNEDSYNYFAIADLVVFPGTHSVYWEIAAGVGAPLLVKYWEGVTHIDVGGNCEFLRTDEIDELENVLWEIIGNKEKLIEMKKNAMLKSVPIFSYNKISQESII